LVEELGWARWIRVVVSGEESFRKPDPRPLHLAFRKLQAPLGRHLFVGDSEVDLQTARNAGVEGVFLGYGYGDWGKTSQDGMIYFEEAVSLFRWMGGAPLQTRK
jgi:phosphoglycolate phosphatase-like HAD superfamily hydrolase